MKLFSHIILVSLIYPVSAHAVLGERSPSSQKIVSRAARGTSTLVQSQSTAVDNALTIKEFVDSTGLVYAVRWQGSHPPDLNSLLGQYFPEYKMALVSTPFRAPRRGVAATSNNLQIAQFGHPGALTGIIYLKNSLPSGIQPEDLK